MYLLNLFFVYFFIVADRMIQKKKHQRGQGIQEWTK